MCKKEDPKCTPYMDIPDTSDLLRFQSPLTCGAFTPYGIIEDCAPFVCETQSIRVAWAACESLKDLDSDGEFAGDDTPSNRDSVFGANRRLSAQSDKK